MRVMAAKGLGRLCTSLVRSRGNSRGFSLLELLVALAVAGILLGLGGPALRDTVQNARRTAALNGLVRAIHLARAEAIRGGREVVLCARGGGADLDCGHSTASWAAGWLVFVNGDRDRPPRVDPGEQVLLAADPVVDANVAGNRAAFRFLPFNRRSTNGTLVYCDDRGDADARALIVSYTGRPRVSERDASGRAIACHG